MPQADPSDNCFNTSGSPASEDGVQDGIEAQEEVHAQAIAPSPSERSTDRVRLVRRRAKPHRERWQRAGKYLYHRFVRMQGSPDAIARGLAVGVFSGWFPWFGFQIVIAIALAMIVRGNKIAAASATWVSNPFTYVPIFAFNYRVGYWLLGQDQQPFDINNIEQWSDVVGLGTHLLSTLFFGCLVVGVFCATGTYFTGLVLVRRLRHRHQSTRRKKER